VCCSVLQCVACVAVCCNGCPGFNLSPRVTVCCNVLQCVAVCCNGCPGIRGLICRHTSQCVAVCCSVIQSVAVCCSLLQSVAVCCSALQCVAVCCNGCPGFKLSPHITVCCSVLQCVAVRCSGCPELNLSPHFTHSPHIHVRGWVPGFLFGAKWGPVVGVSLQTFATHTCTLQLLMCKSMSTYKFRHTCVYTSTVDVYMYVHIQNSPHIRVHFNC